MNEHKQIGIVYHAGYGSGWLSSTGIDGVLDQKLAHLIKNKNVEGVENHLRQHYTEEDWFIEDSIRKLSVSWVEEGTTFKIRDYDGYETIEYLGSEDYYMAIERKPNFGDWISVDDRLPDVGLRVLVNIKGELAPAIAYRHKDEYREGIRWEADDFYIVSVVDFASSYASCLEDYEVTHWMPLPTPPEVVSAEIAQTTENDKPS